MTRKDVIGLIVVSVCCLFAIAISSYHVFGDHSKKWNIIWAIAENGVLFTIGLYVSYLTEGFIKVFFKWVFAPYALIKLIYDVSCFAGIFLLPPTVWEFLWSKIIIKD